MKQDIFDNFFTGKAEKYLLASIDFTLAEDASDLTSYGLFTNDEILHASIVAKKPTRACGLPLIPIVLERTILHETGPAHAGPPMPDYDVNILLKEGEDIDFPMVVATMSGPAPLLLKAERVILNYISHLSGIAALTQTYVDQVKGTGVRVLDTRKTLPGLRYPEKYAVLIGGAKNHRIDLAEMLMLKDNHIDQAGSISKAVRNLRSYYTPCPPIIVECRTRKEVQEAIACAANRIMLDNMDYTTLKESLAIIPPSIESEVSGGVSLENIREIAEYGPDFISVGRLTHSVPAADYSMRLSTYPESE